MNKFRLGWIPDIPDIRDIKFSSVFHVSQALPPLKDLREDCSPIEDQGELGSCTANALVGALEFLEMKAGVNFSDLSRLFVYYNERAAEGNVLSDSGAMLRTGIKVLRRLGVCRESKWLYNISKYKELPTSECYREGLQHQVTAYQRLKSPLEMRSCLAMGLPFVFGFSVYESMMTDEVAKTGIVPVPTGRDDRQVGGHAIMAVGYDDVGRKLIFRNSWGKEWGQAGYGFLPYDYLEDNNLSDDFWCIQATENDLYAAHRVPQNEVMV